MKEQIDYIVNYLVKQGIKKSVIEANEDTVVFKYKDTEYLVYLETNEDVHYGIQEIDGVAMNGDFYRSLDVYGDYTFIEGFFESYIKENHYSDIKKIWKACEKLEMEVQDEQMLDEVIRYYFNFI
jgi:hypothetical protein